MWYVSARCVCALGRMCGLGIRDQELIHDGYEWWFTFPELLRNVRWEYEVQEVDIFRSFLLHG